MPILRREQAVWELREGFNAHTQERTGSMGTEKASQNVRYNIKAIFKKQMVMIIIFS
jgi:hypothetical protein